MAKFSFLMLYIYTFIYPSKKRSTKITILSIHHITTGHISMGRGLLSICYGFRSRGILSCGSSWSSFLVRKGDNRFQVEVLCGHLMRYLKRGGLGLVCIVGLVVLFRAGSTVWVAIGCFVCV